MSLKQDIVERIERDFGRNADGVLIKSEQLIAESPELFTDRILRCIIFASAGNVSRLKHFAEFGET